MFTTTKNKYKTSVFKPRITCMQNTSLLQKKIKIMGGHKITKSI